MTGNPPRTAGMRQAVNTCHGSKAPMCSILPRPTDTLLFYPIFPLRGCLDTTSSVRLQWEAPITCQTLRKNGGNGKELCCSGRRVANTLASPHCTRIQGHQIVQKKPHSYNSVSSCPKGRSPEATANNHGRLCAMMVHRGQRGCHESPAVKRQLPATNLRSHPS